MDHAIPQDWVKRKIVEEAGAAKVYETDFEIETKDESPLTQADLASSCHRCGPAIPDTPYSDYLRRIRTALPSARSGPAIGLWIP